MLKKIFRLMGQAIDMIRVKFISFFYKDNKKYIFNFLSIQLFYCIFCYKRLGLNSKVKHPHLPI